MGNSFFLSPDFTTAVSRQSEELTFVRTESLNGENYCMAWQATNNHGLIELKNGLVGANSIIPLGRIEILLSESYLSTVKLLSFLRNGGNLKYSLVCVDEDEIPAGGYLLQIFPEEIEHGAAWDISEVINGGYFVCSNGSVHIERNHWPVVDSDGVPDYFPDEVYAILYRFMISLRERLIAEA